MPITLTHLSFTESRLLLAYIDPGSGSLILQGIVAGLAAVMVGLSFFYNSVKSIFLSLFGKKAEQAEDEMSKE